eukprot:2609430-Amphidinium_carterae.1
MKPRSSALSCSVGYTETPCAWKASTASVNMKRGCPQHLTLGEYTILSEFLQEVTAPVPLQAPAITELLNSRLACTKTVSMRGFMKELRYTHKKIVPQGSLDLDPATAADLTENLVLK